MIVKLMLMKLECDGDGFHKAFAGRIKLSTELISDKNGRQAPNLEAVH